MTEEQYKQKEAELVEMIQNNLDELHSIASEIEDEGPTDHNSASMTFRRDQWILISSAITFAVFAVCAAWISANDAWDSNGENKAQETNG